MAKRTASAVRWFLSCGTRCTPHVPVFYKVEDGHNKAQKLADRECHPYAVHFEKLRQDDRRAVRERRRSALCVV